jgi:group I intron endonuclease
VFECYLITNTINGKRYVGQAWYGAQRRWREHVRLAGSRKRLKGIDGAIQKYGAEAFTFEVIGTALNERDLDDMEQRFIAEYATFAPAGRGYNLTIGGGGCQKWQPTEENLKNIAAANRRIHADPAYRTALLAALHRTRESSAWQAAYAASMARVIAETDAADPEGAAKRARMRKANARHAARKRGANVPKLIGPEAQAAADATDPTGAEARAKARESMKRHNARVAGESVPFVKSLEVAARDLADPEGARRRAEARASAARCNARKRGQDVPIRLQSERGAANIAALDAADPDGAKKRARLREAKARCAARKAAGIPAHHSGKELDEIDPAGADKRRRQRETDRKRRTNDRAS